jgi:hypothetical protein
MLALIPFRKLSHSKLELSVPSLKPRGLCLVDRARANLQDTATALAAAFAGHPPAN